MGPCMQRWAQSSRKLPRLLSYEWAHWIANTAGQDKAVVPHRDQGGRMTGELLAPRASAWIQCRLKYT
jgi:hypothetical protein